MCVCVVCAGPVCGAFVFNFVVMCVLRIYEYDGGLASAAGWLVCLYGLGDAAEVGPVTWYDRDVPAAG